MAEGRIREGATLDAASPDSQYKYRRRIEQKIAKGAKKEEEEEEEEEVRLTANSAKCVDCHLPSRSLRPSVPINP